LTFTIKLCAITAGISGEQLTREAVALPPWQHFTPPVGIQQNTAHDVPNYDDGFLQRCKATDSLQRCAVRLRRHIHLGSRRPARTLRPTPSQQEDFMMAPADATVSGGAIGLLGTIENVAQAEKINRA
jgi:hypothetical protein